MGRPHLKKLRVVLSLVVLVLTAVLFLDFYGVIPADVIKAIVFFQCLPALMKCLAQGGAAFLSLLSVLALTFLAGRVYCSFLCPLGAFMDLVIRFAPGKKRFAWAPGLPFLRYGLLALTVLVSVSGSLVLVNLLDPFSFFGRTMATIARPPAAAVNNLLARVFERFDSYALVTVDLPPVGVTVLGVTLACLGLVVALALKRGRLYCNTICPVGAVLGLVSRVSLFRVRIDADDCVSCGRCERVCKASCIDVGRGHVDVSRCVACYSCLAVCPENCIAVSAKPRAFRPVNPQRRALMALMGLAVLGFPGKLFAQVVRPPVYVKNTIPVRRRHPITPPGSRSIGDFTSACTACYLCVSRCPGKVLQPGLAPYGTQGLLMPHMDNAKGFCNATCKTCGEVCPTGAILPLTLESKQSIQIGVVHLILDNCIVITQKTECGACSEHCPTKAVFMVIENGLGVPTINPSVCIGCGACEYACPSMPHKSIYVDGHPVHKPAERPRTDPVAPPDHAGDFPF
ncbi:4Fe-4S binding protein [Desulfatiferula olefinivorans]